MATKVKEVKTVAATKMIVQRTVQLRGDITDEASTEDEVVLAIHAFATTPAMAVAEVPIKMSKNYQSIGVTIGVHLPCYLEELPDAIEKAYQMALDRVTHEIPELRAALDRLS